MSNTNNRAAAYGLGWLVIAHAVSHGILALRGSLLATAFVDWVPVALYVIGVVGFGAAGAGLLGVRHVTAAISPLLVLAAGFSLVAIVRVGDAMLWFGAVCDAALLVFGVARGYGAAPARAPWRNFPRAAEKSPGTEPRPAKRSQFAVLSAAADAARQLR